MEDFWGDAATTLLELARQKVALLNDPALNKLLETPLGDDPMLISVLSNLAIPGQRQIPGLELTDLPTDPREAQKELTAIKHDPESPYWNHLHWRHEEVKKRATALFQIAYAGRKK
jgi:hypothetical protein